MSENLLSLLLQRFRSTINEAGSLVLLLAEWFGLNVESPTEEDKDSLWRYQLVTDAAIRDILGKAVNFDFTHGLKFLRQKEYFVPNKIPGFEADPLAIFAVAIGVNRKGLDLDYVNWLDKIVVEAIGRELDAWRLDLLLAARVVLKTDVNSLENVVIRCALSSKGFCDVKASDYDLVREQCLNVNEDCVERTLFKNVALNELIKVEGNVRFGKTKMQDLLSLLANVEPALKRWPFESKAKTSKSTVQKWDIQNEYHVQSLAWALLRPIFSDLRDEEYLQSIGYKHPRVDLAIESLRVIIEIKFLRDSTQSALAGLIEQVAADASLYLSVNNTCFDSIIVFVWDNTGSVQHHSALIDGMKQLRGIYDAVIVSRPGSWAKM